MTAVGGGLVAVAAGANVSVGGGGSVGGGAVWDGAGGGWVMAAGGLFVATAVRTSATIVGSWLFSSFASCSVQAAAVSKIRTKGQTRRREMRFTMFCC